jgi:hypothetical protein
MRLGHKRARTSAQRVVRVTNKLGLHARPAAQFVKRVRSFRSEIWLVKEGKRFSASSLIDAPTSIAVRRLRSKRTGSTQMKLWRTWRSYSRNSINTKLTSAKGALPEFRCQSDIDTGISKAGSPRLRARNCWVTKRAGNAKRHHLCATRGQRVR